MELASPITIYWDLPPDLQDYDVLRLSCAEISDCRPLMLQIYSDITDGLAWLLEQFTGSGIAISLTIPAHAFHGMADNLLRNFNIRELFRLVESTSDLSSLLLTGQKTAPQTILGVAFRTTAANWRELPGVVRFCRENGLRRLVLPMQRLYGNEIPFHISSREQHELTASLNESGGVENLDLTIHDPFLWRAFNPTVPFPQAGCQAANTMIAIAPDGGVYPCPTLPVRLGSIKETRLKEIISSPAKKQFRLSLLEYPEECRKCGEVAVCRGGCRGRGLALQGSLNGIDPACK